MTRLFGIAGVQMSVSPFDANGTIDKMSDVAFNIAKNLPWVNLILPVSQSEKDILGMYWKEDLQSLGLYWRAIRDFGVVFHAWIIIGGLLIIDWAAT